MSIGLIGKKAGMSRLFQEDGTSIPVTVVSVAGNFVTDINYQNSISFSGSSSRTNSLSGNYSYITENGWHHNLQGGSSQIEELSAQNSSTDLDGTKRIIPRNNIRSR